MKIGLITSVSYAVRENLILALELMKNSNLTEIDFDEEDENGNLEDYPYVLIQNRHGEILDIKVLKVRIDSDDNFEFYLDDEEWGDYVQSNECLSYSENNVYVEVINLLDKK